ncbi:MAG: DUF3307 domain-containing protein, partial [Chloroflexota bacterium]
MADSILVLAWLVLAHLVADFALQTGGIASAKASHGSRALRGLVAHGLIVAACVAPVGLAYGERGWWLVMVTALTHVVIDRTKVILTRRAAAAALREAHERHEGPQPPEHLGRAWTPQPAALFLADQGAHLAVAGGAWAILLAGVPFAAGWVSAVDGWFGGWDRTAVHAVVSGAVVFLALGLVNIRAASLFVGILVRPVEVGAGGEHRWGGRAAPAVDPTSIPESRGGPAPDRSAPAVAPVTRRWSIRIGPLDARVTAEPDTPAGSSDASAATRNVHATAPLEAGARVGSTIGILERILIVVFVL